jgi:hypothetical protein
MNLVSMEDENGADKESDVTDAVPCQASRMNTNDLYAIGSHPPDHLQGHASRFVRRRRLRGDTHLPILANTQRSGVV